MAWSEALAPTVIKLEPSRQLFQIYAHISNQDSETFTLTARDVDWSVHRKSFLSHNSLNGSEAKRVRAFVLTRDDIRHITYRPKERGVL